MQEFPNMQPLGPTDQTLYIPSFDSLTGWQLVEMIIEETDKRNRLD